MIQKTVDKIESQRLENARLLAENTEQKQLIKELAKYILKSQPIVYHSEKFELYNEGEALLTKAKAHV